MATENPIDTKIANAAACSEAPADASVVGTIDFRKLKERFALARAQDSTQKMKSTVIRIAESSLASIVALETMDMDFDMMKNLLEQTKLAFRRIAQIVSEEKAIVVQTRDGDGLMSEEGYLALRNIRDEVRDQSIRAGDVDVHVAASGPATVFHLHPRTSPVNGSIGDPALVQPRSDTPAFQFSPRPNEPVRQKSGSSDIGKPKPQTRRQDQHAIVVQAAAAADVIPSDKSEDVRLVPAGGTGWTPVSPPKVIGSSKDFPSLTVAATMPAVKPEMPVKSEPKSEPKLFKFPVNATKLFYEDWSFLKTTLPSVRR